MTQTTTTEELLGQNIKTFTIGKWHTQTLDHPVAIGFEEKQSLERLATQWSKSFTPKHKNWISENFSVPSIVIRFDYVLGSDGTVNVFEIEDRPAGLEITTICNPGFIKLFSDALTQCSESAHKNIGICISPGRMYTSDDFSLAQRLGYRTVLGDIPNRYKDMIWFVRSLRDERNYYRLSPHCLTTIQYEGDKSYGLKMGLWKNVGEGTIPWDKPFVVKPKSGCRCENVHLYHPMKPGGGYSTRSKIEQAIHSGEVSYIQEYHSPEFPDFLPPGYALMRRCILIFDVISQRYRVAGGVWESRPKCHKIHGANDAVCGPLVL